MHTYMYENKDVAYTTVTLLSRFYWHLARLRRYFFLGPVKIILPNFSTKHSICADAVIFWQVLFDIFVMVKDMNSWVECVIVKEGCGRGNSCVINDNLVPFSSKKTSKDWFSGRANSENRMWEFCVSLNFSEKIYLYKY